MPRMRNLHSPPNHSAIGSRQPRCPHRVEQRNRLEFRADGSGWGCRPESGQRNSVVLRNTRWGRCIPNSRGIRERSGSFRSPPAQSVQAQQGRDPRAQQQHARRLGQEEDLHRVQPGDLPDVGDRIRVRIQGPVLTVNEPRADHRHDAPDTLQLLHPRKCGGG